MDTRGLMVRIPRSEVGVPMRLSSGTAWTRYLMDTGMPPIVITIGSSIVNVSLTTMLGEYLKLDRPAAGAGTNKLMKLLAL